jgi:Transmembrane secretion effector
VTSPFGRYLAAATLSLYGDWFSTVALVVLLLDLTGSSAAAAGYMLARVVPRLVGAAVGGELADRRPVQRVAAALAGMQGVLTASIIPAAQHHAVGAIYAAVALSQLCGAAARPALLALVPRLVGEDRLARANALVSVAASSSTVAAPAISVPLLQLSHDPLLLVGIDVGSFTAAALLLASLRPAGVVAVPAELRGAAAGVRVVWRDGHLRSLAGAYLGGALAVTTASALLVVAAADRFGGPDRVGALYAGVGAGSLLAGGFTLLRCPLRVRSGMLVAGGLAEIALLGLLTLCHSLAPALATLAASGAAGVLYEVWGATELQRRARSQVLGRAGAAVVAAQYTGMIGGAVAAVVLVPVMGWAHALLAVCCLSAALVAASATGPRCNGDVDARRGPPSTRSQRRKGDRGTEEWLIRSSPCNRIRPRSRSRPAGSSPRASFACSVPSRRPAGSPTALPWCSTSAPSRPSPWSSPSGW